MHSFWSLVTAATLGLAFTLPAAGQQPGVHIDDDEIALGGCVGYADPSQAGMESLLVWTRGDIMLAHAVAHAGGQPTVGTTGVPGPFFYWLDDEGDLSQHVGQLVEVTGELGDFEEGEVEIERDGEFTEITLEIGRERETARVPTSWLGPGAGRDDAEFDIVVRRIDVEDIRVLGACP